MTDNTMLNAALDLARAGLPVFPLVPQGKAPRYKGSFHSATSKPDRDHRALAATPQRQHRGPTAGGHDRAGC